jgi:hypothetical protein
MRRLLALLLLCACTAEPAPTPRPTREISAPTLAPSPTVRILDSETLYAFETPAGANNATSAALPSGQYQPPLPQGTRSLDGDQIVTITLADASLLQADLVENNSLTRVPGVVLLGMQPASYGDFVYSLRDAGYSVLVTAPSAAAVRSSFDAILEAMTFVNSVDPAHLAVIAELELADAALEGCARNLLCDAVGLLSPQDREQTAQALNRYLPRLLWVASAQDDAVSYPTALNLAGLSQRSTTFREAVTGRGAGMLALQPDLQTDLIAWLSSTLPALP